MFKKGNMQNYTKITSCGFEMAADGTSSQLTLGMPLEAQKKWSPLDADTPKIRIKLPNSVFIPLI